MIGLCSSVDRAPERSERYREDDEMKQLRALCQVDDENM
jgi:hypothetical protein